MKKFMCKKIFALTLVAAMLVSLFSGVAVFAAGEAASTSTVRHSLNGWYVREINDNGNDSTYSYNVEIKDGYGKGGGKALYVDWSTTDGGDYMFISNGGLTNLNTSAVYTIDFDIKMVSENNSDTALVAFFDWTQGTSDVGKLRRNGGLTYGEADEDGWQHVTGTTHKTNTVLDHPFSFTIQDAADKPVKFYLDNVVITKDGGTENLAANGDFEAAEESTDLYKAQKINYTDADTFDIKISDIISYSGKKSLHITSEKGTKNNKYAWLYPDASSCSAIEVGESYDFSFYAFKQGAAQKNGNSADKTAVTGVAVGDYNITAKVGGVQVTNLTRTSTEKACTNAAFKGWRKFSGSFTAASTESPRILIQDDNAELFDMYIDDIVLTKSDSSQNLIEYTASSFEEYEPVYTEITSAPSYEDAYGWTIDGEGGKATAEAYDGTSSLYVEGSATIENDAVLTSGTTYDVSLYMKGNKSDDLTVKLGSASKALGEMKAKAPENTEKSEAGWIKYQTTIKADGESLVITVPAGKKLYLDNISVASSGTEAVVNGGFEATGEIDVPDITVEALQGWTFDKSQNTEDKALYEITSSKAAQGKKSLHLKWTPAATGAKYAVLSIAPDVAYDQRNASETPKIYYIFTAKVFVVKGGNSIHIGGWNAWNKKTPFTDVAKGEWKDVTFKWDVNYNSGNWRNSFAIIMEGSSETELYIDDIKLVRESDSTVMFARDFEDKTEGIEVYGPTLYDADLNVISAPSLAHSGQTIYAAAAVNNYDATAANAQILFGVFKNDMLVGCNLSKKVTAEKEAVGAKFASASLTLPEISQGDNVKVKAFLWNSVEGMKPLSDGEVFDYSTVTE